MVADFQRAFGRPPDDVIEAVALFTDGDQTGEDADGRQWIRIGPYQACDPDAGKSPLSAGRCIGGERSSLLGRRKRRGARPAGGLTLDPSSFFEGYRLAMADKAEVVAALPAWVRAWMAWMGIVLPSSLLLAPFRAEARWVLAALVASQIATVAIGMGFGWNRLWGLAHLLFWTPAVALLLARWRNLVWEPRIRGRSLRLTPVLRSWAALTAGTMAISLAFDLYDVARFAVTGR